MKNYKIILSIFAVALTLCFFNAPIRANASTPVSIVLDTTYLEEAIVSDTPVELSARAIDASSNYVFNEEINYSIVSGNDVAEIKDGNKLYVLKAGEFTVRAVLNSDDSIWSDYNCVAYAVTFSEVRITSRIENVTVYTQPIELMGTCVVEGIDFPGDPVKELVYEVVEGPAEIYSNKYLRFLGAGKVVLKASSRYDSSVFKTVEIDVIDPDAGLDYNGDGSLTQGNLDTVSKGCSSSIASGSVVIFALMFAIAGISKKMK